MSHSHTAPIGAGLERNIFFKLALLTTILEINFKIIQIEIIIKGPNGDLVNFFMKIGQP